MVLIFLLFYFIFCILYTELQFFLLTAISLDGKGGDLTRNYSHDNYDVVFWVFFLMNLSS